MNTNHKALIQSQEFESALDEGAEYKKTIMTTYKQQNKSNYERFYDVMLSANDEIQSILDKKKKNRTDSEKARVLQFKHDVKSMYSRAQDYLIPEKLEDGEKSKFDKLIDKIVPVIDILTYIGDTTFLKKLTDNGITITRNTLENNYPKFNDDNQRKIMIDIFSQAKNIKQKISDDNEYIEENIFQTKVPLELQYDKETNNLGLKSGDFKKLVDIRMKSLMANTLAAKEKVDEKIQKAATEKQFEAARAELMRDKMLEEMN
jgi:hypothetical protein